MTTVLAIWGSVIATVSLGWQIFREWRRSQPRVTVSVEGSAAVQQATIGSINVTSPDPLDYWITIELVNRGENVEFLRELDIEEPGVDDLMAGDENFKHGYTLVDRHGRDELIPARGRVIKMIEASELADLDLPGGFVVRAVLASGLVVESGLERFDPEIVEHVRTWNRSKRPDRSPLKWLEQFPG